MSAVAAQLGAALSDRYAVERELGHGGMAIVFLAHDLKHDRQVAIKVLRPELAAALGAERFLREITIAAQLHHPHILPLYDSGEAAGFLYYVMPFVEGESLRDRLERETQLPLEDALQITREVADALSYAHSRDVVHRDIKPENILLESGHAIVADFGIARAITAAGSAKLTETGIAVGTPAYMSPEQGAGRQDLDGRSDLYSLGCVLYEMLAGHPPFTGTTAQEVLARHSMDAVPLLTAARPTVPAAIEQAVNSALAKVPADRFRTAALFGEALRGSLAEDGHPSPPHRSLRRARLFAAVTSAAVLVAVLVGAWRYFLHRAERRDASKREWVLLADFESSPDEPTLGAAVRDLVAAEFDESQRFLTVPPDQLREARRLAQVPDSARLTEAVARHLAYRTNVRVVVEGRVSRVGRRSYAIVLRALAVDDGAALAAASGSATSDSIMTHVQELSRQLRASLGERSEDVARTPSSIEVITSSFEAYRKLVAARERVDAGDYLGAARLAHEAIALDPEFASAWATLGYVFGNLRLPDSAQFADDQARRRPGRLTRRERVYLEARAARRQGEEAEFRAWESVLQEFPEDARALNNLGVWLPDRGRFDEGLATLERAVAASPLAPNAQYLGNYAAALAALGRLDEATAVYERLSEGPLRVQGRLFIAIASANWARVERLAVALRDDQRRPRCGASEGSSPSPRPTPPAGRWRRPNNRCNAVLTLWSPRAWVSEVLKTFSAQDCCSGLSPRQNRSEPIHEPQATRGSRASS